MKFARAAKVEAGIFYAVNARNALNEDALAVLRCVGKNILRLFS